MQAAEGMGFTTVWGAEHHFSEYGFLASNAATLAAVAEKTKTIRLGTAIVVLPLNNPIRVAEEYAFLDHLSGGRLEFGVGRGYQPTEFNALAWTRPCRAACSANRWRSSCRPGRRSG